MNVFSRGVRNAFRNPVRTLSILLILGLSIGLSLVMLIAHQAVGQKIKDVKSSVGNTITIQPAGFNPLSQANNALTTDNLNKVKSVSHVSSLTETLNDRLTTVGSEQPVGGGFSDSNARSTNNQTSLTSPITLNSNGNGGFSSGDGGARLFISGGGSLPANFSPPIQIRGTNNPTVLGNGAKATIQSGKVIDGSKDSDDSMVSAEMASSDALSAVEL